jgi:hypothetical protein
MCWCKPTVRTPCCGTRACHEAAREKGRLQPGEVCPFCERARLVVAELKNGDVLVLPADAPHRIIRRRPVPVGADLEHEVRALRDMAELLERAGEQMAERLERP